MANQPVDDLTHCLKPSINKKRKGSKNSNELAHSKKKSDKQRSKSKHSNKPIIKADTGNKRRYIVSDDTQSVSDKKHKLVPRKAPKKKVSFKVAPFSRPQTAKYAKYTKRNTWSRQRAQSNSKYGGKQSPFSGVTRGRHHSASLMRQKDNTAQTRQKKPPLSSYIDKIVSKHKPLRFSNYKFSKKKKSSKSKHQKKQDSIISVLSHFDDTRSVVSDMSVINTTNARFNHAFNHSLLSNIDGPFSLLPQVIQDVEEKQIFFPELNISIDDAYEEKNGYAPQLSYEHASTNDLAQNDLNMIIEVPVNPSCEVFGNFLGSMCGLCVPALDVVSSLGAAEEYELLSQYAQTIDESGNAHTLLIYEQLDGVSLSDLKQQLQCANISLNYGANGSSDASITAQERIQRYFVGVVRKTFGEQLPSHFSSDGVSMIRDAGFLFAVDLLLFNIDRFPVQIPFKGKGNADNLFISVDPDGDSVLYGLCNRFMGGHNIVDMPDYLVNGGDINAGMSSLLTKQRAQTSEYIPRLEKFLCALADYYQTQILQLPNGANIEKDSNRDCVQLCLRLIANYLYTHCGFELIIIDEYNKNTHSNAESSEETTLKALEVYRNKLIENIISLLCEGILIGVEEIAQVDAHDIDTIIQDIKCLDENMFGIELVSAPFLKVVLHLFGAASDLFELDIEDVSSDEENDDQY